MLIRVLVCLCAVVSLHAARLHATVVLPTELTRLVAEARAIVHGRVVDVRTQATGDRLKVETLVTVQVTSYLKGDLGDEVTFVVPGGSLGRYRSVIVGAPAFTAGEEAVVFLGARPPARPYLLRLGQGLFRIAVDSRTGARTVSRNAMLGHSPAWQPVVRGSAANTSLSLSAFSMLVRSTVEAAR